MAKYIERGRLLSRINKLQEMCNAEVSGSKTLNIYNDIYNEIYTEVSNIETNDLRPERHGTWVAKEFTEKGYSKKFKYTNYFCSECGRRLKGYSSPDDAPYCLQCGAKMDGKVKK